MAKTEDGNQGFIKLEVKQTCLTTTGYAVRPAVASPSWTSDSVTFFLNIIPLNTLSICPVMGFFVHLLGLGFLMQSLAMKPARK